MLTISQLASYAGVTVRAVRHYHAKELLPEPERDHSGYRRYDANTVVRLIRIRTLADAGVPLARIRDLLDADAQTFTAATADLDRQLRAQIRALQQHRRRIARLHSSDSLAVPSEVTDYLERLRAIGTPAQVIDLERSSWILAAARWPDTISAIMTDKIAQLADPRIVRMYQLFGHVAEHGQNEVILDEIADLLSELFDEAAASGELERQDELTESDPTFIRLMDSFAGGAHPAVTRLRELLAERGWTGWTRVERRDPKPPRPRRTQTRQGHD